MGFAVTARISRSAARGRLPLAERRQRDDVQRLGIVGRSVERALEQLLRLGHAALLEQGAGFFERRHGRPETIDSDRTPAGVPSRMLCRMAESFESAPPLV